MPYRWFSGTRKGAWHPTRREAINSAVSAGVARREPEGGISWPDGGDVEQGDGRRRGETRRTKPDAH